MNKVVFVGWAILGIVFVGIPARAEIVKAEGVAPIKPAGMERARQMAILDARNQAALQAGVAIEAASIVNPRGMLLESSRARSTATIGRATVLREWQTGDDFHVQIAVDVEPPDRLPAVSLHYKKKITAVPFPVRKSSVTDDIENVHHGLASELLRRLEEGGRFLTKDSEYTLPIGRSGPPQNGEAVVHLANIYDSQFVIAGEIIDAGISDEGGYLGMFEHQRRRFDIEIVVYDGLSGSMIARHRIEKSAVGNVTIGRDKPFGSASFYATDFGKAISHSIDEAAGLISRDLANLPFAARVIRVEGNRIYIDAGSTSLIAPGDKLVAYRLRKELPLTGYGSGTEYGISETPVATVSIVQVQPKFSVCTLSSGAKNMTMEVGDLVRFDFENQSQDKDQSSLF